MMQKQIIAVLALLWLAACSAPSDQPAGLAVRKIPVPTQSGSGEPNLVVSPQGQVFLSWIENRNSLRLSRLQEGSWSPPSTIARGENWFVNWADFPAVCALNNGSLAAHWLVKSGGSPYAYDIAMAFSHDGGATWSEPITPHLDGTQSEHGFLSMIPWQEDRLMAVWLDGRNTVAQSGGQRGAMTVRYAIIDDRGTIHEQGEIDSRTCDCCQTTIAPTGSGAIMAYRDRSEAEIRDIAISRYTRGRWDTPRLVHDDGWEIHGCPVNGPALASSGDDVALAWYTHAGGEGRVMLSFSADGGEVFSQPLRVDDGDPIGRVDVVWLAPGEAMVSWMERIDSDWATIRVRRVRTDAGALQPSRVLTKIDAARSSGFPRMVVSDGAVVFAWTVAGEPSEVVSALYELK